jgi:hypothetical protein
MPGATKDGSDSNSANEKDNSSKKSDSEETNIHPRKRKLRHRQIETPEQPEIPPPQHFEKPENPFEMFLEIRKQVGCPLITYCNLSSKDTLATEKYCP